MDEVVEGATVSTNTTSTKLPLVLQHNRIEELRAVTLPVASTPTFEPIQFS